MKGWLTIATETLGPVWTVGYAFPCREAAWRKVACSSSCRSCLRDGLESGSAGDTGGKGLGVDGKYVWSCFYFMILSIFGLTLLCHLRGAAKFRKGKRKNIYIIFPRLL